MLLPKVSRLPTLHFLQLFSELFGELLALVIVVPAFFPQVGRRAVAGGGCFGFFLCPV